MKKTTEQLRETYRIRCTLTNQIENERDFKGYVSDQRMLERIRNLKKLKGEMC